MEATKNIVHAVRDRATARYLVGNRPGLDDTAFRKAKRAFGGELLETLGFMDAAAKGQIRKEELVRMNEGLAKKQGRRQSGVSEWKVERARVVLRIAGNEAGNKEIANMLNMVVAGSAEIAHGVNFFHTRADGTNPPEEWVEANVGGIYVAIVKRGPFPAELRLANDLMWTGLARTDKKREDADLRPIPPPRPYYPMMGC